METKECNKCKLNKNLIEFGKDSRNKDGLKYSCKECSSKYKKNYDTKNIDKKIEYNKKYKIENKEQVKEYEKSRYKKNKIKISEYSKAYKEKNKERDRAKNNETKRKYKANRIKKDHLYKFSINIRSLISGSFKKKGYSKKTQSFKILGCSYEEFKNYIESLWKPWMNWSNYGKYNGTLNYGWDIDHIIKLSSAKSEEDIIKLNHHSNLQPLCSYVNRYIKK